MRESRQRGALLSGDMHGRCWGQLHKAKCSTPSAKRHGLVRTAVWKALQKIRADFFFFFFWQYAVICTGLERHCRSASCFSSKGST